MCPILLFILVLTSIRLELTAAQTEPSYSSRNPTFYNTNNNWTSCEEFLEGTSFDSKSIVNVDWKIFYFWNPDPEESYNIRFSFPSPVLVDRFKVELDDDLKPPVNWTDAELFIESSIDFSALCMKTASKGQYRLIPSRALNYQPIPFMTFAFKVVEPGYLGIVNCKYRIAYALAPVDKMPQPHEIEKAASSIKFYNHFNRSHIEVHWPLPLKTPRIVDLMDDEDDHDEDFGVEEDLDFF